MGYYHVSPKIRSSLIFFGAPKVTLGLILGKTGYQGDQPDRVPDPWWMRTKGGEHVGA